MSGIGPDDLDVVEAHDRFTVAELIDCEATGLAELGQTFRGVRAGVTHMGVGAIANCVSIPERRN